MLSFFYYLRVLLTEVEMPLLSSIPDSMREDNRTVKKS